VTNQKNFLIKHISDKEICISNVLEKNILALKRRFSVFSSSVKIK